MKSTADLKEEHEDIATFLTMLDAILSRMQSKKQISLEDLQWLFEFNRDFVLKCHNGKEDCILFPALEGIAVPPEFVNSLIAEHELAWSISKTMRGLIQDYIEGRRDAEWDIIDLGRSYISLMREHIDKEETIFYPLVDEYISRDVDDQLALKFRLFMEDRIGIGRYVDLREMLQYLSTFYGV
jgi:hemerythrin-like domain-containing protein